MALFRPHAMSDLSPECAPKRTSADHSELMGSRPSRMRPPQLIAPDGQITCVTRLSVESFISLAVKFFISPQTQIRTISLTVPALRGAYHDRHERWAWDAVDAAASGAQVIAGRIFIRERSDGEQTNGAEAYGKTVWSWHPLLMPSRRRCCQPDRA